MKKSIILGIVGCMLSCVVLLSCKKKEDLPPFESMLGLINGNTWTSTTASATIIIVQGEGRRIDIYGKNGDFSIGLAGSDLLESSTISPNTTYRQLDDDLDGEDDFTDASNGLFTYAEKNNYGGYTYPFTYALGEFNITSVDTKNKTMSGTYSFRTDDYDYSNPNNNADATIVEITNGEFKNIGYSVTSY